VTEPALRTLPRPTRDRAQQDQDLANHGYCIVADALTPEQTRMLRERVIAQAKGEVANGIAFREPPNNQRIWMLANKGRIFRDLMLHPLIAEKMDMLLGPDFLLSSLTANIARPGGVPMYLHTDQGYIDFWTPKPVVANIAWMLDDFTEQNGGTRLAPGSHLRHERRKYELHETVAAQGPAGAALVFDGRLYHGTGANQTDGEERHAILSYHCRPFIRQQENFFLGLHPKVRQSEREEFLARLGYRIWAGLGRTNTPMDKHLLQTERDPTGPLDESGDSLDC
jgi:ectoine hydroxylase-related dioxygenase (phytanoyl-CoA dioxygenase family)